jgi:quinol monooxygenase YgiN
MLKVVAKMTISPEVVESVTDLTGKLVAETVKENGCINYNFCKQAGADDAYAIIETWEDKAVLDAHMQSEHFTTLIPKISELLTGEIDIAVFDVLV